MTFSFSTLQRIDLAGHRSFGEHAGRLLEGGGRDEGRRLQRSLGDAEQDGLTFGGLLALLDQTIVDLLELHLVDMVARDVGRVRPVP